MVTSLRSGILVAFQSLFVVLSASLLLAQGIDDPIFQPLRDQGLELLAINAPVDGIPTHAIVASPAPDKLADEPALLLSIGGPSTHLIPPNDLPAKAAWARGHRVVSFPVAAMPGDLNLFRENVLKGPDPTLDFVARAKAVLDQCVERKLARRERIVVTGISRYGYLAMRLLAADERLTIGAGFAPVTDWRTLGEFAAARERKEVVDLNLRNFADALAGKRLTLIIGAHDDRVGTEESCRLFLDLLEANRRKKPPTDAVDLYVTPDPGHTCGPEWYELGMKRMLDAVEKK